jgi:phospholipid-transporting ATPase
MVGDGKRNRAVSDQSAGGLPQGRVIRTFQPNDPSSALPNVVITGRYNIFSFFPQNLFEQFRRLANVYFLVLGIIAAVGEYTNYYDTAVQAVGILTPVSAVVLISMIKDGIEDLKRHRTDKIVNARRVIRAERTSDKAPHAVLSAAQWKDLFPGDIIILYNGDEVPADAVVLACGGIQGSICYVETAAIDGESNLKPRAPCIVEPTRASDASTSVQSPSQQEIYLSDDKKSVCGLQCLSSVAINVEEPNEVIDSFNGSVTFTTKQQPTENTLTKDNLLLRGCIMRASEWTVAMIAYTGSETKLSLNSKKPPSKLSAVDRIVNRTLIIAMSSMVLVCIISMISEISWLVNNSQADYLCLKSSSMSAEYVNGGGCNSSMPNSALTFFTFATLFNNFVCISMYVSLEMVYLCQAYFIAQDLSIYDPLTDSPAECHSTGMCADLGQIQYVLSDKTGTLTKNIMKLRRVSVTGRKYGAPIVLGGLLPATAPPPDTHQVPRRSSAFVRADRSEARRISTANPTADFDYNLFRTSEGDLWLPLHELSIHSSVEATLSQASSYESEDKGFLQELTNDATQISDFLRVLVACNTVILMPDEKGSTAVANCGQLFQRLQAESPDEVALVSAAAEFGGHLLVQRRENLVTYQRSSGANGKHAEASHACASAEELVILAVNTFDSDRKRMSVLVQVHGKYVLLVKGADSSVMPLCVTSQYREECEKHIETFASTGLRTLVMAQRELSTEEATEWLKASKWVPPVYVLTDVDVHAEI